MGDSGGNWVARTAQSEHIGPSSSGDNIDAKKVANYGWDGANWLRQPVPLIDQSYDYIGFSNADTNGNYQTIVFKSGGSAGTTARTLTLAYDASSNVTSITRA
jgi:hypothetical protein